MAKMRGKRQLSARPSRARRVVGHGRKSSVGAIPEEALLVAALEATADGILVVDSEGKIVRFNDRFARMWGIPEKVLKTRSDDRALDFVLSQLSDPGAFIAKVRELYAQPGADSFDTLHFKDGRVFERFSIPQRVDGVPVGRVWSFRDVSDRDRALISLSAEMELAQRRIERLNGLWRVITRAGHDRQQLTREVLVEGARALGLTSGLLAHREGNDLVLDVATLPRTASWMGEGRVLDDTLSGRVLTAGHTLHSADLESDPKFSDLAVTRDLGLRCAIGTPVEVGDREYVVSYADSNARAQPFDVEDIAYIELLAAYFGRMLRLSEQEAQIAYLAYHDALTDLPNRTRFLERLTELIPQSQRAGRHFGLVYIDLDRFKQVNDTLGHAAGDSVLKQAAERLQRIIRGGEVLARLGGDEFAVLVPEIGEPADLEGLAKRLCAALVPPFQADNHDFYLSGSIGIVLFPEDGASADELLAHVDAAMYRAKEDGRNHYSFYSEQIAARLRERQAIQEGLRLALAREELILHFQPVVDIRTRRVVGAESLIRWARPDGLVAEPAEFLVVAEETGLMIPIGQWVLRQSLKHSTWLCAGQPGFRLSVNLSTSQFQDPEFFERLTSALHETRADPRNLAIEITESVALHDPEAAQVTLSRCRELGVRVVLDDFGTFYSSLAYLKKLPVDVIKIDRLFVRGLPNEHDDCAIVKSIIALCTSLGREVIAEGVETEEQARWLTEHGCSVGQGYLFGKPVPATQFSRPV